MHMYTRIYVCACVLMVVYMQDETLMDVKACHAEFLTLTQIQGTERSCNVSWKTSLPLRNFAFPDLSFSL